MSKRSGSVILLLVVLAAHGWGHVHSAELDRNLEQPVSSHVVAPPELFATLPMFNVHSMDVNRRSRELVVAQHNRLHYVDTRSLRYKEIEVGPFGGTIVVDAQSGRIFAAGDSELWVYERDGTLVATHSAAPGYTYERISIGPRDGKVYAVQWGCPVSHDPSCEVSSIFETISIRTTDVANSVVRWGAWAGPVIDEAAGNVWFYRESDGRVEIFDVATFQSLAVINTPGVFYSQGGLGRPGMIIVSKLRRAYMVGLTEASSGPYEFIGIVRVFDTVALQELAPISLAVDGSPGNNPGELAFNPRSLDLFVRQAHRVSVIDVGVNVVKTETDYPDGLQAGGGFGFDSRRGLLYIPCNGNPDRLIVISARDYSIVSDIPVPEGGFLFHSSKLDPSTGRFFAAGYSGIHVFGVPLLDVAIRD